jgi:uncharacterized protein
MTTDEIIAATRVWLERSVIGLNLCPFAESVYRGNRVRMRVSEQRSAAALLEDFRAELIDLDAADPLVCETSLLIHPWVLADFIEYNEFLEVCESAIVELGLEGVLQVASFHPLYQFEGTESQDIENYTNRSPFPMLHILREASIERAIAAFPDPDQIYLRNIRTLKTLGHAGWERLWRG